MNIPFLNLKTSRIYRKWIGWGRYGMGHRQQDGKSNMSASFPTSKALHERACRVIPGGVNSGIRKMEQPVPLYFSHGSGARLWDEDGNESIDFQTGQGALLFGHAPAGLAEAIARQATKGTHFAAQTRLEIEVAERLCEMIPSVEAVRMNNSATEAAGAAFRLARGHSGRSLILKFEGHYHGWGDEGLVGFGASPTQWGPDDEPARFHPSEGVISEVLNQFVVARWNDPDHFRRLVKKYRGQLAAVAFEPVLCNTSCVEAVPGMIEAIRECCDEEGMLMIADETITGFRFGASCAQGYYGFSPDLTILGKAVGGGVPFAVLGGRRAAMAKIESGRVIHAGTLNANPLCLAASAWCLDHIRALGTSHPKELQEQGRQLMRNLRQQADHYQIPLRPQGPGQVFHTLMLKTGAPEGDARDHRDYMLRHDAPRWAHLRRCLLEEGIRVVERGLWFLSLAHRTVDLEEAVVRIDRAMKRHKGEWKSI